MLTSEVVQWLFTLIHRRYKAYSEYLKVIDTLHLSLNSLPPAVILKARNKLEQQAEHLNADTGLFSVTGKLKNLRVWLGSSCSVQGSICKYYLGDNLQTLTRKTLQEAIQCLEDQLNLSIREAEIRRLDIGDNLRVRNLPSCYLPLMLETPYFQRVEQGLTGLNFRNSLRCMAFYDKLKETKIRTSDVSFLGEGRHLLRYELRLLKRPATRLGLDSLTAQALCSEKTYMELVDLWMRHYKLIPKADERISPDCMIKNTKALQQLLMSKGIQAYGGKEEVLKLVNTAQSQGVADKIRASRMRRFLREFEVSEAEIEAGNLSAELLELIESRAMHYR